MNIMRFRERLRKMRQFKIITESGYDLISNSPVFVCGRLNPLSDEELEFARQEILDEHGKSFKKAPFPVFSILPQAADDEMEDISLVVWTIPGTARTTNNDDFDWKLRMFFNARVDGNEICMTLRYRSGPIMKNGVSISPFLNWKISETALDDQSESKRRLMSQIASDTRGSALRLIFDTINPANTVLRVDPGQPSKSIEWRKARTHYCIINKSQAQRCQLGKRGPTDHELVRAAHWRRAHMRRLVSDKFKNKKGQLVFVRQSWVGPEEWVGTDKKIYKVINTTRS